MKYAGRSSIVSAFKVEGISQGHQVFGKWQEAQGMQQCCWKKALVAGCKLLQATPANHPTPTAPLAIRPHTH
eukprot:gene7156-472_t